MFSLYSTENGDTFYFQRLWPKYIIFIKSLFVKGLTSLVCFCAFQENIFFSYLLSQTVTPTTAEHKHFK